MRLDVTRPALGSGREAPDTRLRRHSMPRHPSSMKDALALRIEKEPAPPGQLDPASPPTATPRPQGGPQRVKRLHTPVRLGSKFFGPLVNHAGALPVYIMCIHTRSPRGLSIALEAATLDP